MLTFRDRWSSEIPTSLFTHPLLGSEDCKLRTRNSTFVQSLGKSLTMIPRKNKSVQGFRKTCLISTEHEVNPFFYNYESETTGFFRKKYSFHPIHK